MTKNTIRVCSENTLRAGKEAFEDTPDNARLIAAAPELLQAAKIISGWIDRVAEEVTMGPDDQRALNALRAAIAKAEAR